MAYLCKNLENRSLSSGVEGRGSVPLPSPSQILVVQWDGPGRGVRFYFFFLCREKEGSLLLSEKGKRGPPGQAPFSSEEGNTRSVPPGGRRQTGRGARPGDVSLTPQGGRACPAFFRGKR